MRLAVLLLVSLPILLLGRPAPAQGPARVVSTRVTVVVPERRASSRVNEVRGGGSALRGVVSLASSEKSTGRHSVLPLRSATLAIAGIGVFSVSCLETVGAEGAPVGVALELLAPEGRGLAGGEWSELKLLLHDGATIRLRGRELVDRHDVVRGVRATMPAVAFARIAASPSVTLIVGGRRHVLGPDAVLALRRVAATVGG